MITSSSFLPFNLHGSVHNSSHVIPSLVECRIKSQPLDLTNEIDDYEHVTCFNRDLVNQDPPDQCASIRAI